MAIKQKALASDEMESKIARFIKSLNLVALTAKQTNKALKEFQKSSDKLVKSVRMFTDCKTNREEEVYRKAYKIGVVHATRECSKIHDQKMAELHGKMKTVFAAEVTELVDEIFRLKETLEGPNKRVVRLRKKRK